MNKINPILDGLKIYSTNCKSNKKIIKQLTSIPNAPMIKTAAIGATGVVISTFIQDYNKTVDNDNFFQFKIDPQTDEPYKCCWDEFILRK